MTSVLVACFSHSGTTRGVAEQIHQIAGGNLFEMREAARYPRDYNTVVKQAKQEIAAGFKPELLGNLPDISEYDLVFLGSPNWWSTIAPPVATFLTRADFSGRTIAPFITHGGGGLGQTVGDIRQLCPAANVLEGFDANRRDRLSDWVKSIREG